MNDREAPWAIILAGGKATRLGPLTAQMNKALVSIGQKPIIAHQLEALRSIDVRNVLVVAGRGQEDSLADVIQRSHAGLDMSVRVISQHQPQGPGHALWTGVANLPRGGPVFVLMADTYFDVDELRDAPTGSWVGVASPPSKRHWCFKTTRGSWEEGETDEWDVAVGVYRFNDRRALVRATTQGMSGFYETEALMAPMLNYYEGDLQTHLIRSWRDVGDIKALGEARRRRFISRPSNHMRLDEYGRLRKYGTGENFDAERRLLSDPPGTHSLWPMVYNTHVGFYEMEFIDLPSLAELWLFWPGTPDMWRGIIEGITERLHLSLWSEVPSISYSIAERAYAMYCQKMVKRLHEWDHSILKHDVLRINGETYMAGASLFSRLVTYFKKEVITTCYPGTIHGDLNFSNVLYSLGTGMFKLVDPRGSWGGIGPYGDVRYELAKLRYSYADHFISITHGLFECHQDEEEITLKFGPERYEEIQALDTLCDEPCDLRHIKAIEASIFLSSMPLHPVEEQVPLYAQGVRLANEVLG
jgi:GTP:adenosylcobinamide-phosphate guanylyltransferase